jgi:hypothetical protein
MATKTKRRAAAKRKTAAKRGARRDRRWSSRVTRTSNALDLQKRSAESSRRRKGTPYRSAMSMLTFYINRAGKNMPQRQKRVLQRAKQELRQAFGRA